MTLCKALRVRFALMHDLLIKVMCCRWRAVQAHRLVEMGFEHARALSVLQTTDGSVEEALHALLSLDMGVYAPAIRQPCKFLHIQSSDVLRTRGQKNFQ